MTHLSEYLHRLLNGGEQNRQKNRERQGILWQDHSGFTSVRQMLDTHSTLWETTIPTSGVWGVDLAGIYDGVPDYAKLKARGCRIVIIKAVDGTIKAKLFDENVKAARDAGMDVVGAYFWLYRIARISAVAQATAWWNAVKLYGLD